MTFIWFRYSLVFLFVLQRVRMWIGSWCAPMTSWSVLKSCKTVLPLSFFVTPVLVIRVFSLIQMEEMSLMLMLCGIFLSAPSVVLAFTWIIIVTTGGRLLIFWTRRWWRCLWDVVVAISAEFRWRFSDVLGFHLFTFLCSSFTSFSLFPWLVLCAFFVRLSGLWVTCILLKSNYFLC